MKSKLFFCRVFAVVLSGYAVLAPAPIALADTSHSGTIGSETWSSSDNVHIITDEVIVDIGETLTIEEGVIVKFRLGRSVIRAIDTAATPWYNSFAFIRANIAEIFAIALAKVLLTGEVRR